MYCCGSRSILARDKCENYAIGLTYSNKTNMFTKIELLIISEIIEGIFDQNYCAVILTLCIKTGYIQKVKRFKSSALMYNKRGTF